MSGLDQLFRYGLRRAGVERAEDGQRQGGGLRFGRHETPLAQK
jgi:hypothetical protein